MKMAKVIKHPTHKAQPQKKIMTKKRTTKMAKVDDPEQRDPEPPAEPEPESDPEPKDEEHSTVAQEGECDGCGWKWGDLEPHEVHITPQNVAVPVEGTVAPPTPPEPPAPDPNACDPIYHGSECPKCGWTSATGNPHPVF